MLKKDINAFFKAIRSGNIEQVAELVQADKSYLTVCNFAPPKKDDGQSGLQVAFKTGHFAIAELLMKQGADVNFQEASVINEWTAPILHDCIRATLFNTYTLQPESARFDQAITLLQSMLERGANPQALDSYGNTSLHRALLDAQQMLNHPWAASKQPYLLQQVRQVFATLLAGGADPNLVTATRPSASVIAANFSVAHSPLWQIFSGLYLHTQHHHGLLDCFHGTILLF